MPRGSASAAAVIALDFGGTKVDVALATDTGRILRRTRMDTRAEKGPDQVIDRAVAAARDLVEDASGRLGREVVAYAAVSPGVIWDEGVALAPNLPGWDRLPFARRLAEALDLPTIAVSNDVRAGALAEVRFGSLQGLDPAIYLSLGTGLAAALIVDQHVVRGAHHAAGEIAYLSLDPYLGTAVGRASLEDISGGRSLAAHAARILGSPVEARELFASPDPVATHLVHQALTAVTTAVADLAVFVDCQAIAVGGGMMGSASIILPVLQSRLNQVMPFPATAIAARFTEDASLHGAIALAVDAARVNDPRGALPELDPTIGGPR
jgi:glucokinase